MLASNRLKLMRQRLGLSQAGAAALLGTSLRTYQGWEAGKKPVATEIMIEAMAGYLEQESRSIDLANQTALGALAATRRTNG